MVTKIADFSSSCKFNWRIENFSELNAQHGTQSDVISVGSFKWKAHIYPKGNSKVYDQLSLFLCPFGLTNFKSVHTEYSFAVVSQTDPNNKVKRVATKNFPVKDFYGWGWSKFMSLGQLHDPDKGYLVNDTCVITVEITCTAIKDEKICPNKVIAKTENLEGPVAAFFIVLFCILFYFVLRRFVG